MPRKNSISEVEKQLLLSLISKNLSVIENKKTDAAVTRSRSTVWDKITELFNSSALTSAQV